MKIIHLIFVFCLLMAANTQIRAQSAQEQNLIDAFIALNAEDIGENDIAKNKIYQNFDAQLVQTLQEYDITTFHFFAKTLDSLNAGFRFENAESADYQIFILTENLTHWNYLIKDKIVVSKAQKTYDYYYAMHELGGGQFLLITRRDDMSWAAYDAYVCAYKSAKKSANHKENHKVLSVCSWTTDGGKEYYEPIKIMFDPTQKIISYTFNNQEDGKLITRKAKYKNGSFKIKSYDARAFEE